MVVHMRVVYIFDMSSHIRYMWVGGGWHCKLARKTMTLTREVADIRIYHISWNFLQLGYAMIMVVDMKVVYTFNMSDHTKYMRVGARRHHGWQGQFGGEDQGDCRHPDVSLRLEFSSTWIWNAAVMVVDINLFTFSQCDNLNMWVDGWRHCGWQG